MRIDAWRTGVTMAVAIFAAACAPQTEVVKLYDAPARGDTRYARLLVVNVASTPYRQQQFESEIVNRLTKNQVEAVASHTMLDKSDSLLQEDIQRTGDAIGADGILITHIASVDTAIEVSKGRVDVMSECRGGDPLDYFLYDRVILAEPDSVKVAHTVVVITNLYDARTQDRIWTIQSTCFEKSRMSEAIREEANAIVRQLGIDKLI